MKKRERKREGLPTERPNSWMKDLYAELATQNRLKTLPDSFAKSLSSNDYLGLARHPKVLSASIHAIRKFGAGASGSRFLSGNHLLNTDLEKAIAEFKTPGNGHGIVFSSGYHANLSIMNVLGDCSSVIYSDQENHASLIDGLRSTKKPIFIYPHNDWEWVKDHLSANPSARPLIVTESIFSMSGDIAPIKELYLIAQCFNGIMVIDDAHGTGIIGENGRGVLEKHSLEFDPGHMILTGTFSKALGSLGGFAILGKKEKKVLLSCARPFIYTTALPPGVLGASLEALNILSSNPSLVQNLQDNSFFWNYALASKHSSIPIIPIKGDLDTLKKRSETFAQMGLSLPVIKYPTVPKGKEQLRLSVNLNWDKSIYDALFGVFNIQTLADDKISQKTNSSG